MASPFLPPQYSMFIYGESISAIFGWKYRAYIYKQIRVMGKSPANDLALEKS